MRPLFNHCHVGCHLWYSDWHCGAPVVTRSAHVRNEVVCVPRGFCSFVAFRFVSSFWVVCRSSDLFLVFRVVCGFQICLWFSKFVCGFQICFWASELSVVFKFVCGFQLCLWFSNLFVVFRVVCGFQICLWFSTLFVVFRCVCGFQSCPWFSELFVVFRVVCGFQSCLCLLNPRNTNVGFYHRWVPNTFNFLTIAIPSLGSKRFQLLNPRITIVGLQTLSTTEPSQYHLWVPNTYWTIAIRSLGSKHFHYLIIALPSLGSKRFHYLSSCASFYSGRVVISTSLRRPLSLTWVHATRSRFVWVSA